MGGSVVPVRQAPALRLQPTDVRRRPQLVVADLHLGLEASAARPRGPPEASADAMAETLIDLARGEGVGGVWVAGDVKHPIAGTPPFLRSVLFDFFATLLGERLTVDVVLGNHDPGLVRHLPREVRVHPSTGAVLAGVGIAHGHRWPSPRVLARDRLLIGHLHPGYRFAPTADHPDGKHRCWLRIERPPPSRRRRGDRSPRVAAREIIVLPPFNPIAGVEALNRERPSRGRSFLFRRLIAGGVVRAYLLDGTDLGVLPTPPPGTGSARRAPPGR